jgi:hypothetical protein
MISDMPLIIELMRLTLLVLAPRELLPKVEEPRAEEDNFAISSSVTPSSSCRILALSISQLANIRAWNWSLKLLMVWKMGEI